MAQGTVGEALVRLLEGYGVDLVFGIPGVHTLELYKGLPASRIRHVLTRHEQGAAFMADGYARVTGKPGVCFLITGPGVTNAATAIGEAYSDSVPMLVISTVNERATLGKGLGQLHEMQDQRALTAPITGFSATALAAGDVPELIARAFQLFKSERPRPVHIEIPIDLMGAPAEGDWKPRPLAGPPGPAADDAELAAQLLGKARRPLLIAGGGALGAGAELTALAERLGAIVVTTVAAKGAIAADHPLAAGQALMLAKGRTLLEEADCTLVVGSELAQTDHWTPRLPFKGALIRVDLDPRKLVDLYPATLPIQADARKTLQLIQVLLGEGRPVTTAGWGADRAAQLRAASMQPVGELKLWHLRVLEVLQRVLPANGVVASDMTQIAYTGNLSFQPGQARGWLHPCGFGTLGYGLPAAIGAALGAPDRPVVAIAGDGGLLYTVQDLATAVDERLPLVVLLWHNHALGQIRDDMIQLGMQQIAVTPKAPDFPMLARAFGAKAASPDSLDELEGALRTALADRAVTLIEVRDTIAR